jgi:hypothetical protein
MARRLVEPDRSLPADGSSWIVLYREKEYPRGTRNAWHHSRGFRNEEEAEREGMRLRQRGYHAIVERRPSEGGVGAYSLAEAMQASTRPDMERRLRPNRRG